MAQAVGRERFGGARQSVRRWPGRSSAVFGEYEPLVFQSPDRAEIDQVADGPACHAHVIQERRLMPAIEFGDGLQLDHDPLVNDQVRNISLP
jgi:hypothetical protein